MPRITTESGKGGNCKDEEEISRKERKGRKIRKGMTHHEGHEGTKFGG
jgi:hypothetical protein